MGNDVLLGDGGADIFVVSSGDGADTITDLTSADGDKIDLSGFTDIRFFQVLARATQVGSDTVIDFGNGDTLTLTQVAVNGLRASEFILSTPPAVVRDFNLDGKSDIVLQNDGSGQVWGWEMSGAGIVGSGLVASPAPGWQVKTAADFTGDGGPDIVLQHTGSGQVWLWAMSGTAVTGGAGLVASPSPGWHIPVG